MALSTSTIMSHQTNKQTIIFFKGKMIKKWLMTRMLDSILAHNQSEEETLMREKNYLLVEFLSLFQDNPGRMKRSWSWTKSSFMDKEHWGIHFPINHHLSVKN